MQKIGVIDIGSNSIRLVIVQISENSGFRIINEVKESVRLGKDMTPDGQLNAFRMQKAIQTLQFFKELCVASRVNQIIAVATEAVRKALNGQFFIDMVKKEQQIDIRILSGDEEAYYDYFGVINSMDFSDALIIDIGGCSTELILVKERRAINYKSLPFGAINLSDKFSLSGSMGNNKENTVKEFILKSLKELDWLKDAKHLPILGVGGTIRNIGKIHRKKTSYPIDESHNYFIPTDDVINIYNSLKSKTLEQKKKVKGLSSDRADIFMGACSVVTTLIEYCNTKELYVSGSGIREGLIFEHILKDKTPVNDVLDFSINNIINFYSLDKKHSNHVWHLCQILLDNLKAVHNLKDEYYKVFKVASMLHDLGVVISYYDHQNHSFYMILNSKINGITHREQLMAAYISIYHRQDEFYTKFTDYKSILNTADIDAISKFGVLLKLAEILDKRMNSCIKDIQCTVKDDIIAMKLISDFDISIETNEAMDITNSFENIFNKKLIIV